MKQYDLSNISVLVVDSSEAMRSLLRRLLKEFNLGKIMVLDNGKQAIEYFNKETPDLLIIDWVTNDISGLEVVKTIRTSEESQNQYAAIIMMSGLSSYDSIIRARDSGIHEFLAKPLSPKTLYEKVCHVIDYPRSFVRCEGYFGPDRRRSKRPLKPGVEDRRKKDAQVETFGEQKTAEQKPDEKPIDNPAEKEAE